MSLYLGTLYIMIIYINNMPRKYIPIDIYHSEISYEPYIIVPVEYLIYQKEIESNRIYFKIQERDKGLKGKRIVVIKKGRQGKSQK